MNISDQTVSPQHPKHNQKNIVSKVLPKNTDFKVFPKHADSKILLKNRDQKNIVSKVLPKNSVPPVPPKVIDVPRSISKHFSNHSDSLDSPHVTNAKSHKKSTVVIDPTINQIYLQSILTHLKFGYKKM